jgi:sugar/nucleoside kinase (ribokinase family)
MASTDPKRHGIMAAGNFIVDHVKIIDYYPAEETLASILEESFSNGGGPYNVLKDLALLGAAFPLQAAGLLGNDPAAAWIREDCIRHGIDATGLKSHPTAPTSYTDAFTVQRSGKRTFFHQAGANAHLSQKDLAMDQATAKIFYLGYLMLLDTLDAVQADGTTQAAAVLAAAQAAGMQTVVDCVSKDHADYARSGAAALPFVDVLMLNELEAFKLLGKTAPQAGGLTPASLREAAVALLERGVQHTVVIHAVPGAVAVGRHSGPVAQGSLALPPDYLAGATGAGDAFAAGFLYAWHEDRPAQDCLRHAVCAAACCLAHPAASAGMRPMAQALQLAEKYGYRADWQF